MLSGTNLDNRRGSVLSQISTASIFSGTERRRSSEISVKRKLSLLIPTAQSKPLAKKKEKRKSIISIVRTKTTAPKEDFQQEKGWVEDLVDLFTVPVAKLHINDDKGILSKDNSIERLINLTLILSFVLAGIASAALAQLVFQFGFGPITIFLPNEGKTTINLHVVKYNFFF